MTVCLNAHAHAHVSFGVVIGWWRGTRWLRRQSNNTNLTGLLISFFCRWHASLFKPHQQSRVVDNLARLDVFCKKDKSRTSWWSHLANMIASISSVNAVRQLRTTIHESIYQVGFNDLLWNFVTLSTCQWLKAFVPSAWEETIVRLDKRKGRTSWNRPAPESILYE